MDFSSMVLTMYSPADDDDQAGDERVLGAAIEQALLTGALGFNPWFTEHHFRGPWHSNPIQFAAYVAPQIPAECYLGFGVLSTPYYHPVRLVESMNLLDQLTKGHTLFGIGSGFPGVEPAGLGVEAEYHKSGRAAQDTLDVVQKLWNFRTGDPEYAFKVGQYEGKIIRRVTPAPYRKRHPIVIRTASRDASLITAARNGWPVFVGATGSEASAADQLRTYRAALSAADHPADVVAECLRWCTVDWLSVVVAETDEEAHRRARLATTERMNMRKKFLDRYGPMHGPVSRSAQRRAAEAAYAAGGDLVDALVGDPDTIAGKVRELADIGINHILVRFLGEWHGETRDICESSMRLFAREVAPRFRNLAPPRDLRAAAATSAV